MLSARVVSRFHAVISSEGGGWEITDLGSLAGTFVNGEQIRTAPLHDGDEVWVGTERFIFGTQGLSQVVEPRGIRIDAVGLTRQVKAGTVLLHPMNLSVMAGELVAIVGGSGAGKSTLLNALSGVKPATDGRLLYNGRDYYGNLPPVPVGARLRAAGRHHPHRAAVAAHAAPRRSPPAAGRHHQGRGGVGG